MAMIKIETEKQLLALFEEQIKLLEEKEKKQPHFFMHDLGVSGHIEKKVFYMLQRYLTDSEKDEEIEAYKNAGLNPPIDFGTKTQILSVSLDEVNTLLENGWRVEEEFPLTTAGDITMPRFFE